MPLLVSLVCLRASDVLHEKMTEIWRLNRRKEKSERVDERKRTESKNEK